MEEKNINYKNKFVSLKTTKEYGNAAIIGIITGIILRSGSLFFQVIGSISGIIGLICFIVWITRRIQKKS